MIYKLGQTVHNCHTHDVGMLRTIGAHVSWIFTDDRRVLRIPTANIRRGSPRIDRKLTGDALTAKQTGLSYREVLDIRKMAEFGELVGPVAKIVKELKRR